MGAAHETVARAPAGNGAAEQMRDRENGRIRVMRDETDEPSDDSSIPLEELVTKVFFSLALLLLGGVLSWYFLPHSVVVPVLIDPSGKLIDVQTGEVVGDLQPRSGNGGQADPAKSNQTSNPDAGKKGDDAKSK
jgi:hypothetical protein